MTKALEGLKPELVWKYFGAISKIPRGSTNEAAVARFVVDTAKALGLEVQRDSVGNVIVRKPATAGRENARPVCLQGHMDMVCEKLADKVHDFMKDPITIVRDGNYLKADGTTLGADNGVAVATNLAVMESKDIRHGPIEFLFTVDEESALTGASHLDPGLVRSRTLINLDSEEEGALYVGCSGGLDTTGTWKVEFAEAPAGSVAMALGVRGLKGGHSGLEIDKGRTNALKVANRIVMRLAELGGRLSTFSGGNKHNAIPREADAVLYVPKKNVEAAQNAVEQLSAAIKAECAAIDPDLTITFAQPAGRKKGKIISGSLQKRLCRTISAMPHGVIKMSPDIPGLVETSTNLAILKTERRAISIITSQRSSVASEITDIARSVASLFELAGAEVVNSHGYPGWKPNLNSPILELMKTTHKELSGREPHIKAIHAGLECGLIGEKCPGMDMVSFGPTLEHVHTPEERIHIDTVERFWNLLIAVLNRLN